MDEKSSMIKVLPLIGLIVLVGGVLAYIARAGEGSSAPLPHDKLGAASALLQRGFAADPFPTETDRLAERRDAAGAFVVSDPEKGSPADVIPTITEYLEDEDPMVRSAGAMSVLRIALSEDAWNSGLREAVRTDVRLVGALTQTVG